MSQPQEIRRPAEKARSTDSDPSLHDQINVRAYEFYQQRGGEEGHDLEDWLRAEEEIFQSRDKRKAA